DRIHITVVDDGHGMTQETLANLFKPYFTTKKSGLGLGLSLTQRIMASHGGQINVESEAGVGSSFVLVIPINSKKLPKEDR
ncbi:ATP-binding protein, partial [Planctomycetota bacterium]|nr:ATP-binding protein [Planctomycetota bacterium]